MTEREGYFRRPTRRDAVVRVFQSIIAARMTETAAIWRIGRLRIGSDRPSFVSLRKTRRSDALRSAQTSQHTAACSSIVRAVCKHNLLPFLHGQTQAQKQEHLRGFMGDSTR